MKGYEHRKVLKHLDSIGDTLEQIFEMARSEGRPTHVMADRLAEQRLTGRSVSEVA